LGRDLRVATYDAERVRFLSDEWFAAADPLISPVAIEPSANCAVQFEVPGTRFHLVVHDGKVTSFAIGDLPDSDVELHFARDAAARSGRRQLGGDDAWAAATAYARMPSGNYSGPPAPADIASRPELEQLPEVPGADLIVQYRFRNGPWGLVRHVL